MKVMKTCLGLLLLGLAMVVGACVDPLGSNANPEAEIKSDFSDFSLADVANSGFVSGSLVYAAAEDLSMIQAGQYLPFRLTLTRPDGNTGLGVLSRKTGVIGINSISQDQITVSWVTYDETGIASVVRKMTLAVGELADLDQDGVADLAWQVADTSRTGFAGARFLSFLTDAATGHGAFFDLPEENMPRGRYPSGMVVVNPNGSIVFAEGTRLSRDAILESGLARDGDAILSLETGNDGTVVPRPYRLVADGGLRLGVRTLDTNRLAKTTASASTFESLDITFKGQISRNAQGLVPSGTAFNSRMNRDTVTLLGIPEISVQKTLAGGAVQYGVTVAFGVYLDVDLHVESLRICGNVDLRAEAKLAGNLGVKTTSGVTYDLPLGTICSLPSTTFYLGVIPVTVGLGNLTGGVELTTRGDTDISVVGTVVDTGAKAGIRGDINQNSGAWTPYTEYWNNPASLNFKVTKIPDGVVLSPYLQIQPSITLVDFIEGSIPIRVLAKNDITINKNASGVVTSLIDKLSLDAKARLQLRGGIFSLGIEFFNIGTDWLNICSISLGQYLFNLSSQTTTSSTRTINDGLNMLGNYDGAGGVDLFRWTNEGNLGVGTVSAGAFSWTSYGNAWNWVPLSAAAWKFDGDFDGDGKKDVGFWYSGDGNIWVGKSTGSRFNFTLFGNAWPFIPTDSNTWRFTGDFNGDGKTDLGFWYGGDGNVWIGLSTGTGFTWSNFTNMKAFATLGSSANFWRMVADFNGDGKDDIGFWSGVDGNILVATSTGTSFGWGQWSFMSTAGNIPASGSAYRFVGDLNGDGKSDMGYWNGADGNVWVGVSSGSRFTWTIWNNASSFGNIPATGNAWKISGDFNGDGKKDIGFWYGGDGNIWIGTSTGSGIIWTIWKNAPASVAFDALTWRYAGDFDGDGKTDLGYWDKNLNMVNFQSTGTAFTRKEMGSFLF